MNMKQVKFTSLQSKGPTFPKPFDGNVGQYWKIGGEPLSDLATEMLWKAARFIGSDYEKEAFTPDNNMWLCLKPELTKNQQKMKWPQDFRSILVTMKDEQEQDKLRNKNRTKEEKLAEKAAKDKIKEEFLFAELDGKIVKMANFQIEPANWILTRGADPRKFLWKYEVKKSDVTINIVGFPKVAADLEKNGFSVKADNTAMWAMKFKMYCGPHTNGKPDFPKCCHFNKTIGFHGEADIRQKAITGKFDKASDILKNWNKIQAKVLADATNCSLKKTPKHEALIVYLIQETGIRVGGGRDSNRQAMTYGISTLEGRHVTLDKNGFTVTFNFLGKDSVPETRTISIDENVWYNLESLLSYRDANERIFNEDVDVNGYLKKLHKGATVKNLRTVKCNEVLVNNLKIKKITKSNTEAEKLRAIFEANLEIAKQLNHQKNVGKNQKEGEQKIAERIAKAQTRVKELKKKHKEKIVKLDAQAEKFKVAFKGLKILKEKLANIEEQKVKLVIQMEKAKLSIEKTELALDKKKLTKDISLGTSLANYADYRILKSYCDEIGLPMERVFTATQMVTISKLVENTPITYWRTYPS